MAAGSSGSPGFETVRRTRAAPGATTPSWFDVEPALAASGWRAARRLARRARASWPMWLGAALLISGVLTARRALVPPRYEVTTVLRVSEGALDASGSNLSGGTLRSHVSELAFTSEHLAEVMRRHADWFPGYASDSVRALTAFREAMEVAISDDGFIEDRGPGDPPRAARLAVTFRSSNPEIAWTVSHELGELLAGATLESQRAALEREAEAAAATLRRTQDDLARLVQSDPRGPSVVKNANGAAMGATGGDPRVRAARERWRAAQSASAAATMALRAGSARQRLRFDIVDPGRKPEGHQGELGPVVTRFISSFLAALVAGWLLAGAFDPRVVDSEDLELVGIPVLGQLPSLPTRLSVRIAPRVATREGSSRRPRV